MIEILNLSKYYGKKEALHSVSFSVKDGEIVGLIGKNGAGKSTILKSIAGLLEYDSGTILFDGSDCKKIPGVTQNFGILIDCAFLDYVSAYDNLKLLYQLDNCRSKEETDEIIDNAFKLVGLSDVKRKRVKTYSFGMKQRLGLAQAIVNARSFIMLDEPFIGLDPIGKDIVKKAIIKKAKEENYAVLFSSHDLDDVAEICDRIVMIDNGKCVYNDIPKRECNYRIFVEDLNSVKNIAPLLFQIASVQIEANSISFVDTENNSQINNILEIIMSVSKIKRIVSSSNVLKNMFEGSAVNEENY